MIQETQNLTLEDTGDLRQRNADTRDMIEKVRNPLFDH